MPKSISFVAAALTGLMTTTQLFATEAPLYLPDPGIAPEGISARADGTLVVGSITQGRLLQISPDTKSVVEFAPAGSNGMVSVIGVHVSQDDASVYACSSDPGAGALTGTAAPALLRFDSVTSAPSGRFELPEGGVFCNDIAELPDGTILATDSFVPRIYALRPGAESLEIWYEDADLNADGFNFNGIAYDDGAVYFLRYSVGALNRIAVKNGKAVGHATEVPLPTPIKGADGLNALGDGRFLVIEGGGLSAGSRGSLLGLTIDEGNHVSVETLAEDLNVPTTAVVSGNVAYVVEGQLDHLFDPEAGPADPYNILAVDLPAAYH